uniref:Uncharacterized protein n=1 Tax=Cacopsylla melanoneura TaxID=428564 RepID=A0A8D8M7C8_9HEMI
MRVDTRQNLHMLLLLFNLLRSQGPQYFQETWNYLQTGRLHSLGLLEIPHHQTQIYGNSYHVSVARLWNSLRRDIRDSQSLQEFPCEVPQRAVSLKNLWFRYDLCLNCRKYGIFR